MEADFSPNPSSSKRIKLETGESGRLTSGFRHSTALFPAQARVALHNCAGKGVCKIELHSNDPVVWKNDETTWQDSQPKIKTERQVQTENSIPEAEQKNNAMASRSSEDPFDTAIDTNLGLSSPDVHASSMSLIPEMKVEDVEEFSVHGFSSVVNVPEDVDSCIEVFLKTDLITSSHTQINVGTTNLEGMVEKDDKTVCTHSLMPNAIISPRGQISNNVTARDCSHPSFSGPILITSNVGCSTPVLKTAKEMHICNMNLASHIEVSSEINVLGETEESVSYQMKKEYPSLIDNDIELLYEISERKYEIIDITGDLSPTGSKSASQGSEHLEMDVGDQRVTFPTPLLNYLDSCEFLNLETISQMQMYLENAVVKEEEEYKKVIEKMDVSVSLGIRKPLKIPLPNAKSEEKVIFIENYCNNVVSETASSQNIKPRISPSTIMQDNSPVTLDCTSGIVNIKDKQEPVYNIPNNCTQLNSTSPNTYLVSNDIQRKAIQTNVLSCTAKNKFEIDTEKNVQHLENFVPALQFKKTNPSKVRVDKGLTESVLSNPSILLKDSSSLNSNFSQNDSFQKRSTPYSKMQKADKVLKSESNKNVQSSVNHVPKKSKPSNVRLNECVSARSMLNSSVPLEDSASINSKFFQSAASHRLSTPYVKRPRPHDNESEMEKMADKRPKNLTPYVKRPRPHDNESEMEKMANKRPKNLNIEEYRLRKGINPVDPRKKASRLAAKIHQVSLQILNASQRNASAISSQNGLTADQTITSSRDSLGYSA